MFQSVLCALEIFESLDFIIFMNQKTVDLLTDCYMLLWHNISSDFRLTDKKTITNESHLVVIATKHRGSRGLVKMSQRLKRTV